MTGQTLSQVCVQAMAIGLDVLDIEHAAQRPVDATDVTDVVNRIAAALSSPPPYERRTGADRRHQLVPVVPLICACCAGSIRPRPNDPRYLRQHADGRREPLCQACVAECPPGYVHPPEPDLGDPAAVEEAVREEVWATENRPPLSATQLLREVTERNEP